MLDLKYETYQDVRTMLVKLSIPIWVIFILSFYYIIIPNDVRLKVANLYPDFLVQWLQTVGTMVALIFISIIISYITINILKIHDKLYDYYCVKWRYNNAIGFIIPNLLRPFHKDSIPQVRSDLIKNHLAEFMENNYYVFVGDRDMKIRKNLVVRFYEKVTEYWLSQVAEIVVILFILSLAVLTILSLLIQIKVTALHFYSIIVSAIIFLVLLFISNQLRKKVNIKIMDEINDIHLHHIDELKMQYENFLRIHNVQ
jgi:hypothetical protein